jgi:hypothetical protein
MTILNLNTVACPDCDYPQRIDLAAIPCPSCGSENEFVACEPRIFANILDDADIEAMTETVDVYNEEAMERELTQVSLSQAKIDAYKAQRDQTLSDLQSVIVQEITPA